MAGRPANHPNPTSSMFEGLYLSFHWSDPNQTLNIDHQCSSVMDGLLQNLGWSSTNLRMVGGHPWQLVPLVFLVKVIWSDVHTRVGTPHKVLEQNVKLYPGWLGGCRYIIMRLCGSILQDRTCKILS